MAASADDHDLPLAGISVVELAEGTAGPYAGKLLALLGAEVTKVEPAPGDRSRHIGALVGPAGPEHERRAGFLHLNTGKRSVALAVDRDSDVATLEELLRRADVVIDGPDERSLPSLGTSYESLRATNPSVTIVTVTSFGRRGPYAGYKGEEIVQFAMAGTMSSTGVKAREPMKQGGEIGRYQAGSVAALAAMAGLAQAERTGRGVHVDLSEVDTQLVSIDRRMTYLLYYAYTGRDAPRTEGRRIGPFPSGLRLAEDGNIWVSTMPQWLPRMLRTLDDPELAARYQEPDFMTDVELSELAEVGVMSWGVGRTRRQAMEEAQANGWAVTPVNAPVDILEDPHFRARGYWHAIDHPVAGRLEYPGPPMRLPGPPAVLTRAPLLDEHRDEIEREVGTAPTRRHSTRRGSGRESGRPESGNGPPLSGVRILDMTVVWAGPYATMLLGDLGAEVIRVDNPWVWPTSTRGMFPRPPAELVPALGALFGGYPDIDAGPRPWNRVGLFTAHARNKRSVTLGVHKPLGRETFLRLAEHCDVLIENNSVDLMDKLGIGWDDVSARNPRLIMVRLPSVGLEGPYRSHLGFGINFESLCGFTAIRGYADADLGDVDAVFHMDAATGPAGALAVMAALRQREKTGRGALVEVSQCENMMNHIGELIVEASGTGVRHERIGNRHRERAPQGVYRCRDASDPPGQTLPNAHGPDRWAVISVGTDAEWAGLCRAMGDPAWSLDDRFGSAEGRRDHHDQIDAGISGWTATLDQYEVFQRCQAEGVPAAPVLTESGCYADPHLRERGLFRETGSDELGTHEYAAHIFGWDGPALAWGPIPRLGEHNRDVYQGVLGMTDEEYAALEADGHIAHDYLDANGAPL